MVTPVRIIILVNLARIAVFFGFLIFVVIFVL